MSRRLHYGRMRIVLLALTVLVVSGCDSASISPTVSPPAVSEAVPRSGVEELATVAVDDYLTMSSTIAAEGGVAPERIASVVTDRWLPEELAGFETLRALGSAQRGIPDVTRIEVSAIRGISAVTEVILRACTDFGGVSVATVDGEEREVPTTLALVTLYVVPEDGVLKVDRVEPRADATWCVES